MLSSSTGSPLVACIDDEHYELSLVVVCRCVGVVSKVLYYRTGQLVASLVYGERSLCLLKVAFLGQLVHGAADNTNPTGF